MNAWNCGILMTIYSENWSIWKKNRIGRKIVLFTITDHRRLTIRRTKNTLNKWSKRTAKHGNRFWKRIDDLMNASIIIWTSSFTKYENKIMRTNKHHKIPRSRNWSQDSENIKHWDIHKHIDRHVVFANNTPAEQLIKVLTVNNGCRTNKFRKALIDLLIDFEWSYYKDQCFKDTVKDDLSRIK